MSRFLNLGDRRLPGPAGGVKIAIGYKAAGKVDVKEHDGADDGDTTWKGRKPRDVSIDLTWLYDIHAEDGGPVHQEVCAFLLPISPAGPDAGKPQDFAESDAARQKIANVKSIMVEDFDLPAPDFDKGTCTLKLGAKSWSKPKPKPGDASKTPKDPSGWKLGHPPIDGSNKVNNFGGNGNTITFPTTPKVQP